MQLGICKEQINLLNTYCILLSFGQGAVDIKSYLIFTAAWRGKSISPRFANEEIEVLAK